MRGRLSCAALLALAVTLAVAAEVRGAVNAPVVDMDSDDDATRVLRFWLRARMAEVSEAVAVSCRDSDGGPLTARLEFGVLSSGLVEYIHVVQSSGRRSCDTALTSTIRASVPFPASVTGNMPIGVTRIFVVARLEQRRFAGMTLARPAVTPYGPRPSPEQRTPPPTPVEPPFVVTGLFVIITGLSAFGVWTLRRRRADGAPLSRELSASGASAVPPPRLLTAAAEAPAATAGPDRFRLTIDFSDRRAMLDFFELLRRGDLLPRAARAHPVDPATPALSPATETYVVIRPDDPPSR